jgi:hypothetical protein
MKILIATLILSFCALAAAKTADSAPIALLNKLKFLAGSNSRDCGSVPLGGDRNSAITCAKDANSSGSAYRVAFQLQGTDSSIWQGAARDDQGKLWVAFSDSDSSGDSASNPTLSVLACRGIMFVIQGGEVLDCMPFSGDR